MVSGGSNYTSPTGGLTDLALRESFTLEREADRYLQDQVFALLDEERYSEQIWAEASNEERRDMLEQLYNEVQEILGTHAEGIDFVPMVNYRGLYSPSSHTISMNSDVLEQERGSKFLFLTIVPDDSYDLLKTVVHEMRHVYQYETVRDPSSHVVSERTRQKWEINQNNYISFDGTNYDAYISQTIEFDSESFARQTEKIDRAKPTYRGGWIE